MDLLKNKIVTEGRVEGEDIIKVDSFLNHQVDVELLNEIGKEFKRRFEKEEINKILTIEASGIAIACLAAQHFNVPVVFAKKTQSKNLDKDVYETEVFSFTKGIHYKVKVSKKYLNSDDKVLVLDDFLANGRAALGLKDIVDQSGANLVGIGIVIEKSFQDGCNLLAEKGIRVESLAKINGVEDGKVIFK
ncbi:xanthine phosphoribosyltransferase [Sporosalibacterium faouarense]|uniref:xanthine phosphoribosyltransferase n=1 Tax=Sporosalibacterium faouarense TaxID=516123 RepID=UPI00141D3AC4|nr:xanthine phosphoribosyltransferase [Sporosalibacterium faouarense]MTI49669.1 xanthine phosphoribosyltransferase [Bacillota bacterium]